jgi:hypothetical protein
MLLIILSEHKYLFFIVLFKFLNATTTNREGIKINKPKPLYSIEDIIIISRENYISNPRMKNL